MHDLCSFDSGSSSTGPIYELSRFCAIQSSVTANSGKTGSLNDHMSTIRVIFLCRGAMSFAFETLGAATLSLNTWEELLRV